MASNDQQVDIGHMASLRAPNTRKKKQKDTAADFTAQELEECAALNVQ